MVSKELLLQEGFHLEAEGGSPRPEQAPCVAGDARPAPHPAQADLSAVQGSGGARPPGAAACPQPAAPPADLAAPGQTLPAGS